MGQVESSKNNRRNKHLNWEERIQIETQSEGMLCQGGMFQFDLLASSSRPGTLKLSGSTDLKEWQSISSAQIAKTETDKFSVTVPTEGHSKYFVKPDLQSVGQ